MVPHLSFNQLSKNKNKPFKFKGSFLKEPMQLNYINPTPKILSLISYVHEPKSKLFIKEKLMYDYQKETPVVLIEQTRAYELQIAQAICAIGNFGYGLIFICKQYDDTKINKGFNLFSIESKHDWQKKFLSSIQTIQNKEKLSVSIDIVGLTSFFDLLMEEDPNQFVIRITVNATFRNCYFVRHQIGLNFSPRYLFYTIKMQQKPRRFVIQSISVHHIYEKIQLLHIRRAKQMIVDKKFSEDLVNINLGYLTNISLQPPQDSNKQYIFSSKREDLLMSCCKIFFQNRFEKYFQHITLGQKLVVLQTNNIFKVVDLTEKLQLHFWEKIRFHLSFPMPSFQKQINEYLKNFYERKSFYFCFLIFKGQPLQIQYEGLQLVIPTNCIETVEITYEETQLYLSLIWEKYTCVPKIVHKKSQNRTLITLIKQDPDIWLYSYYLFAFARLRPAFLIFN